MSILLNFHAGKKNSDKLVILIETERYTRPTHSRRCLDDRKYPRGYTKRAVLHVFAPWPEENFPACVELLPSRERSLTKFVPLGWKQRNWKAKVGEGNDRSLAPFLPCIFVSFRLVSFPPATYDHVIGDRKMVGLAVVNFGKEWKVRSTGFDPITNAFDLVCYYAILAFMYARIGYDTIYPCWIAVA